MIEDLITHQDTPGSGMCTIAKSRMAALIVCRNGEKSVTTGVD